jgi:N-acetylgalactosamine-6-sulfatase
MKNSPGMRRLCHALAWVCFCICTSGFAQKPSVVILLADDLGYGDLSCYGCPDIRTPHLDRLAAQGVRFTNFYANGPECTPTRAALLSGRYPQRVGGLECAIGAGNIGRYDEAQWLAGQHELGLPAEDCTLPMTLKSGGYQTAIIGKWHLGYDEKFRPNTHGFDDSIGPIGFGGDYFYHVEQASINQPDFKAGHALARNGREVFRDGQYMTELITEESVKWIGRQTQDTPFFLYVPFTAPHSPYQGPMDDMGRPLQGAEWDFKSREKYVEMVEAMDKGIGDILSALETAGVVTNTIVIFFSDNGGTAVANNGILSGFKGQVYEGGIRVPCIIRWPGKIAAHSLSTQCAISTDLSRSILELSGAATGDLKLDGYHIIEHVRQNREDMDRTLFWRLKRGTRIRKAVRDGPLKYLVETDNGVRVDERLFNLQTDPAERKDLLPAEPERAGRLKEKLHAWEQEVTAPRLQAFHRQER